MRANEFLQDENKKEIIRDFIKFCRQSLKLDDKLPKIKFSADTKDTRENHRMGYFDPNQDFIWIYVGNRNMADILRTLCHELVHTQQRMQNRIGNDTSPDSDIEKEADMVAGQMLKIYGKQNRGIYD